MLQRLSLVTLGVADLAASRRFYEDGLGWKASSASVDDATFFDAGGVVVALYPRHLLAADAQVAAEGSKGFGGIVLAHNVGSRAEVDAALASAARAGATITKAAAETFWGGYSGYFCDPDGYPWEVAHNPGWPLDEHGRITLPS